MLSLSFLERAGREKNKCKEENKKQRVWLVTSSDKEKPASSLGQSSGGERGARLVFLNQNIGILTVVVGSDPVSLGNSERGSFLYYWRKFKPVQTLTECTVQNVLRTLHCPTCQHSGSNHHRKHLGHLGKFSIISSLDKYQLSTFHRNRCILEHSGSKAERGRPEPCPHGN